MYSKIGYPNNSVIEYDLGKQVLCQLAFDHYDVGMRPKCG